VEFAGLENDGLENDGLENDGLEQEQTSRVKLTARRNALFRLTDRPSHRLTAVFGPSPPIDNI